MNKEQKQALVDSVPVWWHTMDFGDGVVTPGLTLPENLERMASYFPDVKGKRVLDIGAWDGYMSFEAERRGANGVVALDEYVWVRDFQEHAGGEVDYVDYPGKRGFDVAHTINRSGVETHFGNIETTTPEDIGTFDVVLFLGVLYHLESPYTALHQLYDLTSEGGVVLVETQAIYLPEQEDLAILEFYDDDLNGDASNWFAPNLAAAKKMFKCAGFKYFELLWGHPPAEGEKDYRLIFRVSKNSGNI